MIPLYTDHTIIITTFIHTATTYTPHYKSRNSVCATHKAAEVYIRHARVCEHRCLHVSTGQSRNLAF